MSQTTNFGLETFGPEGRLADNGHKFTGRDRRTIDALLWQLFHHDHGGDDQDVLVGFNPVSFPQLTLIPDTGLLPAGRTYHYKISYVDINGNETEASAPSTIDTPAPLLPPEVPSFVVETTGGTLPPGTYYYAFGFYQTAPARQTQAPNTVAVVIPAGTNTNKVTFTLPTALDASDGWNLYRKAPTETEYYRLAQIPEPATEYVDDGTVTATATQKRPTTNTTNSFNTVQVDIPASELPLDQRIKAWRIYRTEQTAYPANSLVATVSGTTTEGGSNLVTTFTDTGTALGPGVPLLQSTIPPNVPGIDASSAFSELSGRIASAFAPLGVFKYSMLLPGALVVQDYNQFVPTYDMEVVKLEAFFLIAPTGVDVSNYVIIRVSDNSEVDEVQKIWVDTTPRNEVQRIVKVGSTGTFTLSFDGQGPTASTSGADPSAAEIKGLLESLTNIVSVNVTKSGTRQWDVEFTDPGNQNVVAMTGSATIGSVTVTTLIEGTDGGTFTLTDGIDITAAIAFNASNATMETRLQTDITSIVDVTVTGTGTEVDPWVVTWVDPGGALVPLLQMDKTGLNGTGLVESVIRGHAPTVVDLIVDDTGQYHSWATPAQVSDEQEAEDAPAVSTGADVSDARASNGIVTELTGTENVTWPVGVLPAGRYIAKFHVAPLTSTSVLLSVIDDNGPTTIGSLTILENRPGYTPAYEIVFETDGVMDLVFKVAQVSGTATRVDKMAWELDFPTLHAGAICTVEVLEVGTPTTNGEDAQFALTY